MQLRIAVAAVFLMAVTVLASADHAKAAGGLPSGAYGYDVSWPQCGADLPAPGSFDFAIVGVNGGKAFTQNPCLDSQFTWAQTGTSRTVPGLYVNTNSAPKNYRGSGCARRDTNCHNLEYGKAAALNALAYAEAQGAGLAEWYWLDVETENSWSRDKAANSQVLRGMYEVLRDNGKNVGIYSTAYQYGRIAGTYSPAAGIPLWIAGWSVATDDHAADCLTAPTFAGGTTAILQWTRTYDENYVC